MRIYGRKLLAKRHHSDRFGDKRHSDSGDIIFLIRYVTTRDHMFKGLCELWMEAPNMANVAIGLVQVKI